MPTSNVTKIPHLITAQEGPLQDLERLLLQKQVKIETWFRQQWRQNPAPIYGSVDLRNAGFKLAPVDTNLFPAGFNNLNEELLSLGIEAASSTLGQNYPHVDKITLIPENHTRNMHYLESLAMLQRIFSSAGYEVRIGSLLPELKGKSKAFPLPSGREITLYGVQRSGDKLTLGEFIPDLLILNNDLTGGTPELLKNLEQPITPPPSIGWSSRLKSIHFTHYQNIASEFADLINLDPWFITPIFSNCGEVDFMKREGEECLISKTQSLLQSVQQKYDANNISEKPFAVIKADAGTYGMSVMMVQNAEEISALNRKERARMAASKGKQAVNKVIIQEGVYTFETWGEEEAVTEPVVYMLGHHVIGGFYRVHTGRSRNENLNAPGMHFEPLAFAKGCNIPSKLCTPNDCNNRFYAYGVVARLALLAAARELTSS